MRRARDRGYLLVFAILLAACSKPSSQQTADRTSGNAAVTSGAPPAAPQSESAHAFWNRFRNAVLSDDRSALLLMTRFPFKTRGTMDDDPVVEHNEAAFWPIYSRVLAQDTGSGEGESERQYIERNVDLPPAATGAGQTVPVSEDATQFRVGALEFEKSGERWYWVFAYLEE